MKLKIFSVVLAISIILTFLFPAFLYGQSGVRVKGRVLYYNLEEAGILNIPYGNFAEIPSGRYLPARNLYIEVEFDTLRVSDVKTLTDEEGYFDIFVDKNPLWGTWDIDIEVMAWVSLDNNHGEPITVSCFEDSEDLFQYNAQTGERSVGKNSTLDFDVYIGGPQNNIEDWWDADITSLWDGGAGDGTNHVASFFMTDVIKDGFDWLTERQIEPSEIYRTTCILYPSDETGIFGFFESNIDKYKGMQPPPGTGHIHIIPRRLWPGQLDDIQVQITSMGGIWKKLRGTLLHEFGHKIMHDVYWTFPVRIDFWNNEEQHYVTSCVDAELGWKEGWAEFISAAIQNHPTINGHKDSEASNIEYSYHPDAVADKYYLNPSDLGKLESHYTIINTDDFDLNRDYSEFENAAVLWDIFDEKGWEYLPESEQNTKPDQWDRPLMFYDRLEDNNLSKIWSIVKDHAPDCLMDEEDAVNPIKIEDSFWYYWLEKYSGNSENIHALKAILFNRGILSSKKPESKPSIIAKSVDIKNKKLNVEIKELNSEDRPYLYYNIAYRAKDSEDTLYMFATDQPLSNLGGSWNNERIAASIGIPDSGSWEKLWLMVHDSMMPIFKEYTNNLILEGTGSEEENGETQKKKLTLEEISTANVKSAFDIVVSGNYAYVADWEDGLVTIDVSDPKNPLVISVYDQRTEENSGKWYSAKAIALKDNHIFLATHTGALVVIDVSDPYNPTQAGYFDGNRSLEGITVSGNYAYAAADADGLYIFDISDSHNPVKTGSVDTPNYAFEVDVSGSTAYVAGGGVICAIDVSNPQSPVMLGTSPIYLSEGVAAGANGYVYGCSYQGALQVIDFSNPSGPLVVNSIQMIKGGFNMIIENGLLFIANGSRGMSVYDISVPEGPEELFVFNPEKTRGQSRNVFVEGDYVYLTANRGGVIIFKIIYE